MLFYRSSGPTNHHRPDPHHLLECISSANSIIAIFDLFCRTFGDEYCILSLSYSVYTAASIFLLQIQAEKTQDSQAMMGLKFCTSALERLKASNPGNYHSLQRSHFVLIFPAVVITSALSLITEALSDMGLHLSPHSTNEDVRPTGEPVLDQPAVHEELLPRNSQAIYLENPHFGFLEMFHEAHPYTFNPDGFEISNEVLEAFSYLKPIDATFGSDHDWSN
jgi:hypothetical protein